MNRPVLRRAVLIILISLVAFTSLDCASSQHGELLDTAWFQHEALPQPPRSTGVVLSSHYLTMRDSVNIAVDLYLPENLPPGTRLPTILLQTRYWRRIDLRWPLRAAMGIPKELTRLIENGYAVVRVDVRGSGASFGVRPYPWSPDEVKDGAEVVDWIIDQPWSNGRVGSVGGSYEGTTAEFLLVNKHPAVKAVAPMFALFDVYTDIAYPGGIHLEWFSRTWQKGNRAMDLNRPQDALWWAPIVTWGVPPVDDDPDRKMLSAASKMHEANYRVHEEALQITYRDDVSSGGFSTDTFSPHAFKAGLEASGAAIYSYSGWFDGGYAHSAIKRFSTLNNPGKLILGPWDHGGDDHVRPFAPPIRAKFDHVGELLRFFDFHLKDADTGIYDDPPVHYYTMVEDRWKSAQSWPPPSTPTAYYFHQESGLASSAPSAESAEDVYPVDRSAGTGPDSRWNCLAVEVAVRYPDRATQDKKLRVYESAPLRSDMEVTGHPVVTVYLSADTPDAQLFVYLEDVDENGRVSYVTEGMLRALHRKLSEDKPPYKSEAPYRSFLKKDAQPLVAGQVTEMIFDLLPVSYLFKKRHRIRVAVSGADADHFRLLPGDPPNLRIHRSRQHASRITLPVVSKK